MNVYSRRGIRHRVLGDSPTLGEAATVCGAGTRDMATVRWFGPVADCKKCFREGPTVAERNNRKPVDDACDGSIFCPVPDHVRGVRFGSKARISHVPLTLGQRKTLQERRALAAASHG